MSDAHGSSDYATLDCRAMPGSADKGARAIEDTLVAGACVARPVGAAFPPPPEVYDAWPTTSVSRMHGVVVEQPLGVRKEGEEQAVPFAAYHGLAQQRSQPLSRQHMQSFMHGIGKCWPLAAFSPGAAPQSVAPEPSSGDDARDHAH